MEKLNYKSLFLNINYFNIKNLYFKVINNNFICFNYKIKTTELNALYIKTPQIRLIEQFQQLDINNYKIIIPLLDCDKLHNLIINIDKRINKYIKKKKTNDNYNSGASYLIKDKSIIIEHIKYNYQYILLEFNIKETKIIVNNDNGNENSNEIQLDKLNELDINNYEICLHLSIYGIIHINNEYKLKYKINKINLYKKNTYDNLSYYKQNYLFKEHLQKKINGGNQKKKDKQTNFSKNLTKQDKQTNFSENLTKQDNDSDNDSDNEKDSDDEIIIIPNFELEFDI